MMTARVPVIPETDIGEGFEAQLSDCMYVICGSGRWNALRTSSMLNDLRYAMRTLKLSPGFAITAIVSIGLGIGANATIFSLADGLLFRPLPVRNASAVVTIKSRTPSGTYDNVSYPDY